MEDRSPEGRPGDVRRGPRGWEDERRSVRSYMLVRGTAIATTLLVCVLGGEGLHPAFWPIYAVSAVTALVGLGLSFSSRWRDVRPVPTIPLDALAFGLLEATSGGAQSDLRWFAVACMVAPAIVLPPRGTLLTGAGLGLAYLAGALPDVLQGEDGAVADVVAASGALLWVTSTAAILAALRTTAERRVEELTRQQRRLLLGVLDAEARERRRITRDLHEGPLQHLLAARQDLEEARAGNRDALGVAERGVMTTVGLLRETIADVHPVALDHGGLAAGLRALADRGAKAGGYAATVMVEPDAAGLRDEVLVTVVRELVTNVTEHAKADHLELRVARRGPELLLDVRDDGVGFTPEALAAEQVGLAASRERVEAAGGRLVLSSTAGSGTHVRVHLPLAGRRATDA